MALNELVRTTTNGVAAQERRASPSVANTAAFVQRSGLDLNYVQQQFVYSTKPPTEQPQQRPTRPAIINAFLNTCERWSISQAETLVLLGYGDNHFLGKQILDSRTLVTPQDARDRIAYLLAISVGLGTLFNESAEAERKWLNVSKEKLGDKTPLAFMLEGKFASILAVLYLVEKERGLA